MRAPIREMAKAIDSIPKMLRLMGMENSKRLQIRRMWKVSLGLGQQVRVRDRPAVLVREEKQLRPGWNV